MKLYYLYNLKWNQLSRLQLVISRQLCLLIFTQIPTRLFIHVTSAELVAELVALWTSLSLIHTQTHEHADANLHEASSVH